jgi:hypothetical protein
MSVSGSVSQIGTNNSRNIKQLEIGNQATSSKAANDPVDYEPNIFSPRSKRGTLMYVKDINDLKYKRVPCWRRYLCCISYSYFCCTIFLILLLLFFLGAFNTDKCF